MNSDTKYYIKLTLSKNVFFRSIVGMLLLIWSYVSFKLGRTYSFCRALGKYEKLYESAIISGSNNRLHQLLFRLRSDLLKTNAYGEDNIIRNSFLKTKSAIRIREMYSRYGSENAVRIRYLNEDSDDREGNLLILSTPKLNGNGRRCKGVLYLQYNSSIEELAALFDLDKLYQSYVLVIEPSSWGYSDLGLEILLSGRNHIYVMAQDKVDYDLVTRLDSRIIPIRAGAGDWIDFSRLPSYNSEKKYFDVCMIASWRKLKNHKLLFKSLSSLGKGIRIALVGYCWEGRTAGSIRMEQKKYYPNSLVSIFEGVPHEYVFKVLSQSKIAVMLSEREGANRGIYEAVASNLPVVFLSGNRGVNRQLEEFGCIFSSSKDELYKTVDNLLRNPFTYSVKDELFKKSGLRNTWELLGKTIAENDQVFWEKDPVIVSTPNLQYRDSNLKRSMERHYRNLERFLYC